MAKKLPSSGYILGLDVGEKRIGTALANNIARLPQPTEVIEAGSGAYGKIAEFAAKEDVQMIVIGIPRNLSGEETAQSHTIREFAAGLAKTTDIPIEFADESLSSNRADEMAKNLNVRNASRDSLAACFILEEFLGSIDSTSGR